MFLKKKLPLILLPILLLSTSCVETVVVGSLGTGVLAVREKSLSNTGKDSIISAKILTSFVANGLKTPGNSVEINVNEGRVLLTGIVIDSKKANLANDLAWKISNVKEVIDEIQLSDIQALELRSFFDLFFDSFITSEIKARMFLIRDIESVNYQVTTVGKTVYFLGIAGSQDEINQVLSLASKIRGVKKVVNHVILKNDNRRTES